MFLDELDEKSLMLFDKIYLQNLKERKIILNGEIDPSLIETVCMQIKHFNAEDDKNNIEINSRQPVELHISSQGGSVYDGFAAVNSIITSKTPVYTYCDGYVMSMALAIYAAGHKRFAYPYTNFMYHEISTLSMGKNIEIERVTKENKRLQKMYDGIITSRTNVKQSKLDNVKRNSLDWFFGAEDALEMGFVTDLIS